MNSIQELNVILRGLLADCPEYYTGEIESESDLSELIDHLTRTAGYLLDGITESDRPLVAELLQTHLQRRYHPSHGRTMTRAEVIPGQGIFQRLECPELLLPSHAPVTPEQLISQQYRARLPKGTHPDQMRYSDPILEERRKKVRALLKIPFFEQGTPEWLTQREQCLTATAVTVILNEDSYDSPYGMLLDKCGRGKGFKGNEHTQHGSMLEQVGVLWYQHHYNVQVIEHGLIIHPKYPFLGASPDGICSKYQMDGNGCTKLVGRLLEIKFPALRGLKAKGRLNGDICPHQYYTQMQAQCFATGLEECDFLQCRASQYHSWEEYLEDSDPIIPTLSKETGLEKGVIIQLLPRLGMEGKDDLERRLVAQYLYPPQLHLTPAECQAWISEQIVAFPNHRYYSDYLIEKVVYWRLDQVSCHLVRADPNWQTEMVPVAQQFWSYVQFYRQHPDLLDRLQKLGDKNPWDSRAIFAKVHQQYQKAIGASKSKTANKSAPSYLEPLYQETNPWREEISAKKAYWSKSGR